MIGAMKQCGNPWLPVLHAPLCLSDGLSQVAQWKNQATFAAILFGERRPLLSRLQSSHPNQLALLIGPEGGFSDAGGGRDAGGGGATCVVGATDSPL